MNCSPEDGKLESLSLGSQSPCSCLFHSIYHIMSSNHLCLYLCIAKFPHHIIEGEYCAIRPHLGTKEEAAKTDGYREEEVSEWQKVVSLAMWISLECPNLQERVLNLYIFSVSIFLWKCYFLEPLWLKVKQKEVSGGGWPYMSKSLPQGRTLNFHRLWDWQ